MKSKYSGEGTQMTQIKQICTDISIRYRPFHPCSFCHSPFPSGTQIFPKRFDLLPKNDFLIPLPGSFLVFLRLGKLLPPGGRLFEFGLQPPEIIYHVYAFYKPGKKEKIKQGADTQHTGAPAPEAGTSRLIEVTAVQSQQAEAAEEPEFVCMSESRSGGHKQCINLALPLQSKEHASINISTQRANVGPPCICRCGCE
jgi:hypothetical protein